MDLSWEKVNNRKTWTSLTEDEKAEIILFMNKETFTLEEVKTLMEEQRKYIASRFEGPTTLISNYVCITRVLNSNEYELNLRLAQRIKENDNSSKISG